METSGLWPMLHWERQGISQIKPKVHNILHYRRRKTEPRPKLTRTENFVTLGYAVGYCGF